MYLKQDARGSNTRARSMVLVVAVLLVLGWALYFSVPIIPDARLWCPVSVEECEASVHSSWVECRPADGTLASYAFTQSCLYHNIYFIGGRPVLFLSPNHTQLPKSFETMKNRDDFRAHFSPEIVFHPSIKTLCSTHCVKFHDDTSVLCEFWMGNIGHALLDAFYSIFVGLIEYSGRHRQPFRIINTGRDAGLPFVSGVIQRATPLGVVRFDDFFSHPAEYDMHHLRELLVPNYARCISCVNDSADGKLYYGMGMGYELDAFRLLRVHMLARFGLPPSPKRPAIMADTGLNAIAVNNKRFSDGDRRALISAFEKASSVINGQLVDWREFDFRKQLALLSATHIHISGPGTAITNQPYLPDGAVHINLGACSVFPYQEQWYAKLLYPSTFADRIPGYMEQSIVASCPYNRALYYPLDRICSAGLEEERLSVILKEAYTVYTDLFPIPLPRGVNLAPSGMIVQELLRRDVEFRKQITDPVAHKDCSTGSYFWPEIIINEHGPWSDAIGLCKLNHTLLSELKASYQY